MADWTVELDGALALDCLELLATLQLYDNATTNEGQLGDGFKIHFTILRLAVAIGRDRIAHHYIWMIDEWEGS